MIAQAIFGILPGSSYCGDGGGERSFSAIEQSPRTQQYGIRPGQTRKKRAITCMHT
jgi:hypothetical protein